MQREIRVGLLVLVALGALGGGVLLIGQQNNLFVRKNHYFIRFPTVSGLKPGGPVQLNGVEVGAVERVVLPREPTQAQIDVWINVDRSYAQRLRAPEYPVADNAPATKARIQTLGLLGDKYVEIVPGPPTAPPLPDNAVLRGTSPVSFDDAMALSGHRGAAVALRYHGAGATLSNPAARLAD